MNRSIPWPNTVPQAVRAAAFDIAEEVLGADTIRQFEDAGQHNVLAHMVRVAGLSMDMARRANLPETTAARLARWSACHDVGKMALSAPDTGVWTPQRRVQFRSEHCEAGGRWVAAQGDRLPDADALSFAVRNHHTPVPPLDSYRHAGIIGGWWGNLHVIQACDRYDAITSRPYVTEREGAITPERAVELTFGADLRGDTPALPPIAFIDGQVVDLAAAFSSPDNLVLAA